MPELARLLVESRGDIQIVRLAGEVDFSNASKLGTEISDAVPNGAAGLVVDLTATSYFDSAGIRMLFQLAERLQGRRQDLAVVVPPDSLIRHAFEITEVDQLIQISDTMVEALDWIRSK